MKAGATFHIVNTLGQQVADTWALRLPDARSHLSMSHTRLATGRISPSVGDVLVDNHREAMLRLIADTSGGGHDTLVPACDPRRYRSLGFLGEHASCAANFESAVSSYGLSGIPMPDPLNLFMSVPVAPDKTFVLEPSRAEAGTAVVFQALEDLLVVVSACPQDLVPISGERGSRSIDIYSSDAPGVAS